MARIYDNWVDEYTRYTANTEAPKAFHWWTAISTVAGALQRKVYMDMGNFEWVPNFYILLVGKAGLFTKSTSLRIGERLLRSLGKKIRFGSQSGSWQSMADEIAKAALNIGGTINGQGIVTCPVSYFVSEFGTFFDPTNRELVDFFVESWDAQRTSFTRTTKSSGAVRIDCPCLNLIAGTTPTWIKENFTATMIGGGFVSRMIFVKGNTKQRYIPYPIFEQDPDEHLAHQERLKQDLIQIGNIEGPMVLTPDAIAWGRKWYHDHFNEKRQLTGERFDGFYARKQTHLHKLAMILSVAEGDSMKVEARHLMRANEQLLFVEKDLASVVDNVTSKQIATAHKREVISIISGEGSIDRDELYTQLYQMMSGTDFDKAIADLTKARKITISPKGGKTMLSIKEEGKVIAMKAK